METGEAVLYRLRDLMPVYCQYLGGVAVTALSTERSWRQQYNHSLWEVGNQIKRTAQEIPNLQTPYMEPDEVLEKFLSRMFGEAVGMRYKIEKGKFDAKPENP